METLISHIPPGQFGRYLLVGIWNTLFGYLSFAGLTAALATFMQHSYLPACVLSSILNITLAFLAYKWFVFKTEGNYFREWARCVAVYSTSILTNLILLPILVEAIRLTTKYDRSAPYIAGAILLPLGIIYSFFGHKRFSFRASS